MGDIRVPSQCDGCGQVDDHPKHHYGSDLSFHFDCTPHFVIQDMTSVSDWVWEDGQKVLHRRDPLPEDSYHPHAAAFLRAREAALGGTHGSELVDHIGKLHAKHKPHEDTAGIDRYLLAVEKIKMDQHDARPEHLRSPQE